METMLGIRVGMHLICCIVRLKRGFVIRPHSVDTSVVGRVVDEHRRADLRHVFRFGCGAVKRCPGVQVSTHFDGEKIDDTTAIAKARCREFADRQRMCLEILGAVKQVRQKFSTVEA